MVTIYVAYTAPVNPAGATPILTQAQVWAGFQRKVRQPWEFVPAIESAEVLSEEGNSLTRSVVFKQGAGGPPGGSVKEVCVSYAPCRVDYHLDNGSKVINIIGVGPSQNDSDLFVTYAFEWKHDGIEEGSDEAKSAEEKHKQVAKMAVDTSIATTRKLVGSGEI